MPARATIRITASSTTTDGQRPQHRSSERVGQFLERRVGTERAHHRLLRIQVLLECVLERLIAERIQRAEVVAHRRDVGLGSVRELSERDAVLAAFGEHVQRHVHQAGPRPQTGHTTLVHPRRCHQTYSIRPRGTCKLKRRGAPLSPESDDG